MERLALGNKVKGDKHVKVYGWLGEDIGMETLMHGPMAYVKELKLRHRVGDLDLTERRRYTSSREEEDVDTHMCPVWHNNRVGLTY